MTLYLAKRSAADAQQRAELYGQQQQQQQKKKKEKKKKKFQRLHLPATAAPPAPADHRHRDDNSTGSGWDFMSDKELVDCVGFPSIDISAVVVEYGKW